MSGKIKTREQLEKVIVEAITEFEDNQWPAIVTAVNEYLSENPESEDPFSSASIDRKVDTLALSTGWIYDRLRGTSPMGMYPDKRSVTKKLRKALGYLG